MSSSNAIDTGRLGRTLALIGFVTAVFLLLAVDELEGDLLQIGIVSIASVAFITAIVGFLIAAVSVFDDEAL